MKYWKQYLEEAGVEKYEKENPRPERLYQFWAYSSGKVMGPFKDRKEALRHSNNIEAAYCPQQDKIYNSWSDKRRNLEQNALDNWYKDLRKNHDDLSDSVFSIAYSEAYDRGHSSGYDEVASCLNSVCSFVRRIIQETKNDLTNNKGDVY